jgi:hypothetical protein
MTKENNDILYGIDQIRPVVGGASHVTILKWYKEYEGFPMRKLRGQWVSSRQELAAWWRNFVLGEVKVNGSRKEEIGQKRLKNRKSKKNTIRKGR